MSEGVVPCKMNLSSCNSISRPGMMTFSTCLTRNILRLVISASACVFAKEDVEPGSMGVSRQQPAESRQQTPAKPKRAKRKALQEEQSSEAEEGTQGLRWADVRKHGGLPG